MLEINFEESLANDVVNFEPLGPSGPSYNTLHYNMVLDITLITIGPQLDYFCYMPIHFTLIITQIGQLAQKLA